MEQIGKAAGGLPDLNLTAEEKRVFGKYFQEADPDGFGAVSGDVAVKFFERTRLPPDILGQIWQIADTENRGFLTPAGFGVVLRLIGHAQAGRQPSVQIAPSPAPLPKFDPLPGQSAPVPAPIQAAQPLSQQNSGVPASPSAAGGPVRVPALTPEKASEYAGLFEKSGADKGQLSGFTAKSIFERANLPNDVLGKIWGLADTQGRGTLDVTEFIIAMHLLASCKSGAMRGVPSTLPPGLLDAATRRGRFVQRPSSSAGPPPIMSQLSSQNTGYRPQSPIVNRQAAATPLSTQSTGEPWLISAADKAKFDQIFATVDTMGQGFISGEQAVTFFGNARLPEDDLAQVWDLADVNSDGVLNRDEFAVAMFLIRQRRGSRDNRMPQVLPQALIPPSMRKQMQPSQPQTMPVFEDAPITKPRSAADDLFGLDVSEQPPQPPLAARQVAQSTGGTDAGPFANPRPSASPPPAASSSFFKPFVPSSGFGQNLTTQTTGTPRPIAKEASLMDDEEAVPPPKINNDAAELGNLSNQVGNLSRQMQDVSGQRSQAQSELSQVSQQKDAFQQRLTQLRAAYEQEVAQVKALKDQLANSQSETKKLQQEMAMIEGTYADLQTQHQSLASALAADQQENSSLKERIRQTNAENERLKPQLEKLKSDARQQKGLVAINRKQLGTNESERDRIHAEIAAAQHEIDVAKQEAEESARQLEQSHRELEQAKAIPMPVSVPRELSPPPVSAARELSPPAQIASPAASISSNPFFRRQDSGAVFSPPMGSTITSPVPQEHERNTAFDSIFGPSFVAAAPVPETSFGGRDTPISVAADPPAPPEASQINSSVLPLRTPLNRENSINSSVQPQLSTTHASDAHTPRALTPDTSTASPASRRADDPFTSSAVDEEQESVRQTLPRGETAEKLQKAETLPGAFPGSRSETPASAESSTAVPVIAAGAAVAAVATGAGIAAVSAGQSEKPAQEENFDDFFGGPSHKKTLSEQHADFDSAFAGMNTAQPKSSGPGRQEFPDIQELEDDDESSDEEVEARGFEDSFAPASSKAAGKLPEVESDTASGQRSEIPSQAPASLSIPPPLETHASAATLPGIESQQSPPTYADAVPSDNPTHFPMEYKNLLPEREDPTSPPASSQAAAHSSTPPSYGPEVSASSTNAREVAEAPPTKAAPFDFDSAFANVGAAPVADDSESDYDEPLSGAPRSAAVHTSEFDPTFDSPAPSTRTTNTFNQAGSTTHDAVTTAPTNGMSNTAASQGFSNFDDFSPVNTGVPSSNGAQTAAPISHDWDSLFAPLDAQKETGEPLKQVTSNNSIRQATEIAPGTAALTTADEVASSSVTPEPAPATSSSAPRFEPALPAAPSSSLKPERPQPGRALSTGTEHDDPILKSLTSMGWSREESLAALEKFDYNIDKAADYLTFKS